MSWAHALALCGAIFALCTFIAYLLTDEPRRAQHRRRHRDGHPAFFADWKRDYRE